MSCYMSFELVIKSDKKETLVNAIKDFSKRNFMVDNIGTIKYVGNSYILKQDNTSSYHGFNELCIDAKKIAKKYNCQIEIITESIEGEFSGHFYHDGKKSICKGGSQRVYGNVIEYYLTIDGYYSPFISILSKEAASAFCVNPSLLKKWFGFHSFTLDEDEEYYYIGRGYENTDRCIDLSVYDKSEGGYNVKEKRVLNDGKIVLTYDFDDNETLYEYDDNGKLIHKKDHIEETWYDYNSEGNLVEERNSWNGKTLYSYDNQGNVIHEEEYAPEILLDDFDMFDENIEEALTESGNSNSEIYLFQETWYKYNTNGKLIEKRDSCGEIEMYSYDDNGTLVYFKNNWGESWWNSKGELTHKIWIDAHNNVIKGEVFYEYDDEGKLLRERYSGGYEIWYEYKKGRLFKERDSEGNKVFHFYDDNGNQCRKICSNPKDQIIYDTDFKKKEIWYGYDDKGEQTYKINK